jgi:hypothetical protein
MKFQIEAPPDELSDKVRNYLRRQFEAVDVALIKDPILRPADKYVPDVQKPGTLVFFVAAIPNTPITSPGLYFVDSSGYHRIIPFDLASSGAAAIGHVHSKSEVIGLETALQNIDASISSIESQIVGINARLDNIESRLPP